MSSNLVIVGVGGIGSRHFESIIKSKLNLHIEVRDFKNNLSKLQDTYSESIKKYGWEKVTLIDATKDFALAQYDYAIIATGATERLEVLEKLKNSAKVPNVILEKPLYNSINDSNKFSELIAKPENYRLNLPRESMPFYKEIKKKYFEGKSSNGIIAAQILGSNWGVLSNFLHFLRLIEFLSEVKFTQIEQVKIDGVYQTKRSDYFDIQGEMSIINENGAILKLMDSKENSDLIIQICDGDNEVTINESKMWASNKRNAEIFGRILYQSQLTANYFDLETQKLVSSLPSAYEYTDIQNQILLKLEPTTFPRLNNRYKFT